MQTLFKRQDDRGIYRVLCIREGFSGVGRRSPVGLGGEKDNLLREDFLQ